MVNGAERNFLMILFADIVNMRIFYSNTCSYGLTDPAIFLKRRVSWCSLQSVCLNSLGLRADEGVTQ